MFRLVIRWFVGGKKHHTSAPRPVQREARAARPVLVHPVQAHAPPKPCAHPAQSTLPNGQPKVLTGRAWIIDGDTIRIKKTDIRLAGIDAPEVEDPFGQKAKSAMIKLCWGKVITAHLTGEMSYHRVVAVCRLPDGRDLAAELVRQGLAIDWPKFSGGRYRHLETSDARKKLWRCVALQEGRRPPRAHQTRLPKAAPPPSSPPPAWPGHRR